MRTLLNAATTVILAIVFAGVTLAQQSSTLPLKDAIAGASAPIAPAITSVVNNYGFIPAGFPNSGIARGTLFIISGTELADPAAQAVLQNSQAAGGLPKTLNGASVSVASGGTTVTPAFYYAISTALAVVLPSNTPLGTAQVTVTYNNQPSNAFSFQVLAGAPGFDTYYGTAGGLGVATNNATGFLYNYANSIPPGTIITLWGSGLGADPARDFEYETPPFAIDGLAHVYVGGVDAQIIYQGASGFPGLNQADITIPADAPTGCNVSVVGVTAAGQPSNFITLPIGNGPCSDPLVPVGGSTLASLAGKAAVNTGTVLIDLFFFPQELGTTEANAVFQSSPGPMSFTGGGSVSIGGCIVQQSLSASNTGTTTGLNAGTITVRNPSESIAVSTVTLITVATGYYVSPGLFFLPQSGGTFTVTGTGGASAASEKPDTASTGIVGPFTAQVTFPATEFGGWMDETATATITRSAGVTVTWSGGVAGTYVVIGGSSSSGSASGSFTCIAPAAAGTFAVPSYVTAALPASASGTLSVENETAPQTFTAPGLDYGVAIGYVDYTINADYI